jgi:hypothetical protein
MPSRSQIHAQIFIYIIAVFLFSLILIYGYNVIRDFRGKSEQVTYIRFKTDLISTIDRVSPDYGTLKREDFFIGGDFSNVCFVQSYKRGENYGDIVNSIGNPLVLDSFETNTSENTFLFTNTLHESFYAGEINVTEMYHCFDVISGRIKIQFLGKGDHVYLSEWGG